jgi:hypothetical protein
VADGRPGPDERAGDQRDLQVVLAALARLPEIDRAAVLMRADEGVPYEEIAAALGISTLPLTVTFGSDGFHGLLLEDWPARAAALAVATTLWVVYWRMSRRLGARGL